MAGHHHPHVEEHFTAAPMVRDVVIGMADGLTVPFALAAGISGVVAATNATRLVVTAGLAVAAGIAVMAAGLWVQHVCRIPDDPDPDPADPYPADPQEGPDRADIRAGRLRA